MRSDALGRVGVHDPAAGQASLGGEEAQVQAKAHFQGMASQPHGQGEL